MSQQSGPPPVPVPPPIARAAAPQQIAAMAAPAADLDSLTGLSAPMSPGRRRRRANQRSKLPTVILIAGFVLGVGAWLAYLELPGRSIGPLIVPISLTTDPDKLLVEQYLRENLNDPHWSEVRWWPAVDVGNGYFDPPRVQHICQIKIRAKNAFGALVVQVLDFVIEGGRCHPPDYYMKEWLKETSDKYFEP